uniref:Uncharacterized protein n=1 Tax=Octopus bimaculoides TaxID=37653 RepID=A0A0L8FRJ6_OCTBM
MSSTDVTLDVPEPERKKSSKAKIVGLKKKAPPSMIQIISLKFLLISLYVGFEFGLAFFLGIYYVFLWEPVRGNYSRHHIYIGHKSPVFHPN